MIDPNEYWVNNPIITPVNKALMYDNDIDGAVSRERERIIALLEAKAFSPRSLLEQEWSLSEIIALIKGDNK